MKHAIHSALAVVLVAVSLSVTAGPVAQRQIASVLTNFNHFATEQQKATLRQVVNSNEASEAERMIALALIGAMHWPSDADKTKLKAIANDKSLSEDVRTLAQVAHDLQHTVSASNKKALATLIAE